MTSEAQKRNDEMNTKWKRAIKAVANFGIAWEKACKQLNQAMRKQTRVMKVKGTNK